MSIIALTDENGVVKTRYNYSPFGITEMTGEASDNPFKYTGREDDGTGLYYYRARYYSPVMGRFISEDPIGFAGGMNWYAYVRNRPTNLVDPLGLFAMCGPNPNNTSGECPLGVNCVDPGGRFPPEAFPVPNPIGVRSDVPIWPPKQRPSEYPDHYSGHSYDGPGCGGGTQHYFQDAP